jgi:asparagine synthase (glutamine-hydrolysing)
VKPLYYTVSGRRLAFASELKALFALPDLPKRLNLAALNQYLTFLWVPEPQTMVEGVFKIPSGHFGVWTAGHFSLTRYWDLKFSENTGQLPANESALAGELRDRFTSAVRAQMLSDVPLGAFLSAGLDSSSIVAAMAQDNSQAVRTYTVGFPKAYSKGEITLDDIKVARNTARHFGCRHTEIIAESNVSDLLPNLLWHMDEPIADPAILAAYLVNREARKSVTVMHSGVGGDELFAGYRKYRAHYLAVAYQKLPSFVRARVLEPLIANLPSLRGTVLKGYMRLAKKMGRSGSLGPRERFITDSVYISNDQKRFLWKDGAASGFMLEDPWSAHLACFDRVLDADFLNQMLYVDIKTFMVSLNLAYNDKMSMACSLEVRVPFLDHELVEWVAANVPPQLKLRHGVTKYIFRKAMSSMLPAEVLKQRKAGFGVPIDYWLTNDLKEMTDELLSEHNVRKRGLFEPNFIQQLVKDQRRGREDWSFQVWQFLTLELWMRNFLDAPSQRVEENASICAVHRA